MRAAAAAGGGRSAHQVRQSREFSSHKTWSRGGVYASSSNERRPAAASSARRAASPPRLMAVGGASRVDLGVVHTSSRDPFTPRNFAAADRQHRGGQWRAIRRRSRAALLSHASTSHATRLTKRTAAPTSAVAGGRSRGPRSASQQHLRPLARRRCRSAGSRRPAPCCSRSSSPAPHGAPRRSAHVDGCRRPCSSLPSCSPPFRPRRLNPLRRPRGRLRRPRRRATGDLARGSETVRRGSTTLSSGHC